MKTVKYKEYSNEKDCYEIVESKVMGRYKYIGESDKLSCIKDEIYDCIDKDEEGYRYIIDETGEAYLSCDFELVVDDE